MRGIRRTFFVALLCFPPAAVSQEVTVRSGEHADFSRMVFYFKPGRTWSIKDVGGGHLLEIAQADLTGLQSNVSERLSKLRVANLIPDRSRSEIFIETVCNCKAIASLHRAGMLVVDIQDGSIFDELRDAEFVQQYSVPELESPMFGPAKMPDVLSGPPQDPTSQRNNNGVPTLPEATVEFVPEHLLRFGVQTTRKSTSSEGEVAEIDQVAETRTAILEELARATVQGLLSPNTDNSEAGLDRTEVGRISASNAQAIEELLKTLPNVRAQSSIDAGLSGERIGNDLTVDGDPCIPNQALSVSRWGNDTDTFEQIAELRSQLFEEFSVPRRDAAIGLSKSYIYLTFGAEAKSMMKTAAVSGADVELLTVIADIIDDGFAETAGPFEGQESCAGTSALWAVLATQELSRSMTIDAKAVVLAFSGLPIHLRRHLGPKLAQRFLDFEDQNTALAIRNSIERAPGEHGEGFDLLNASLELEIGDRSLAAKNFEAIAANDGSLAAEALIRRIDIAIETETDLPRGMIESVAASAFEYRGTPVGADLARAYVLANIVEDEFDEALSSLLRIETGDESEKLVFPELWSQLALGMARTTDDVVFLSAYYRHRETLSGREVSRLARENLAKRLIQLGFGGEALTELERYREGSEQGTAVLSAQAAMAIGEYEMAINALREDDSQRAKNILARIAERTGEFSQAARIYADLGQSANSENASWRAGEWADVAEGSSEQRQLAARMMTNTDPYTLSQVDAGRSSGEEAGLISSNEAKLAHSVWVRETLTKLLGE